MCFTVCKILAFLPSKSFWYTVEDLDTVCDGVMMEFWVVMLRGPPVADIVLLFRVA